MPDAEWATANVNRKIKGIYGQMLLSRFPIRESIKVDLSVGTREPRRAIDAVVDAPGGPTRVICTHLGLAGPERRFQIGVLCGLVDADPHSDILLMGDINDWRRDGIAEQRLSPLLGPGTRHRTFPAACPVLPLDRIWFRPHQRLVATRVAREAGLASDHLPLVADFLGRSPAPALIDGHRPLAAARTSSTWPFTLTFRQTPRITPSLSIRKVARSMPIEVLPYIDFSTHTP